ncbi:hypothetical protein HDU97_007822 [Phlyctochytrium planicorne]|nr:hypothetical protein HDU97_007822 [Phlyctochytrium planicorne]
MSPRTILITGATAGIGRATAEILASQNHTIIVASRNPQKVEESVAAIISKTGNPAVYGLVLDLGGPLEGVRDFTEKLGLLAKEKGLKIDTLVLNAGIMGASALELTADGFEKTFATNQLGHMLMTYLLLPEVLENSKSTGNLARIVILSSGTHDPVNRTGVTPPIYDIPFWLHSDPKKYDGGLAYTNSKLANAMFGADLARTLESKATVAIYDPGFIAETDFLRSLGMIKPLVGAVIRAALNFNNWWYQSPDMISTLERSTPFLAKLTVDGELVKVSGKYYCKDAEADMSVLAKDVEKQKEVREALNKVLKEKGFKWVDA